MQNLEGKTAVVTGAASGMGQAFAERFAAAGMNVVLADVEEPRLVATTAAIGATGAPVLGVPTDVSDEAAIIRLKDEALERFGAVHVVCNNAGVGGGPGDRLADWEWVMNVNFWGVVHGIRTFLPLLVAQDEGHIVNTASVAGLMPGYSPYSASKWAVVGITEGLFNQMRTQGSKVGVSCLCPGWVATDIADSARNRPEWAAPNPLEEGDDDPAAEMRRQWLVDVLASGMPPAAVADLVYDAILAEQLWIFTDRSMVEAQRPRLEALLAAENPPPMGLFAQD